jgi:hypothetical protein
MQDAILEYFTGEKLAGVTLAAVGVVGLVAAGVLMMPRWELRPTAVVLAVMGLLQLTVGVGLWLKTGPQVESLLTLHAAEPGRMLAEEGARMAKVQANFVRLEILWVALMAAAAAAVLTQKERPTLWGVCLGLALHAGFMLVFDAVAERRGAVYLAALLPRS